MATLGFSTHFPKRMGEQPTYFISKIWRSECLGVKDSEFEKYFFKYSDKFLKFWDAHPFERDIIPKVHTIRADKKNRWKVGDKIHMVVFNRTKNRFQFAPVLEVKLIQKIKINNKSYISTDNLFDETVFIDDRILTRDELKQLVLNDGFESIEQFFEWFNEDFTGKIIHWTDLKY